MTREELIDWFYDKVSVPLSVFGLIIGLGFALFLVIFGKSESYKNKYVNKTVEFKIITKSIYVDTFTKNFIEDTGGEEYSNDVYVKAFYTDTDFVYIKQYYPDMSLDTETYYENQHEYNVGYTKYDTNDKFGDTFLIVVLFLIFNQLLVFIPLALLNGLINILKKNKK